MVDSGTFDPATIDTITCLKIVFQAAAFLIWMRNRRHVPEQLRPLTWFMVLVLVAEYSALVLSFQSMNNTLLYKIWISTMITLLSYWLIRSIPHTMPRAVLGLALVVYFGLLVWESTSYIHEPILFQYSLLFGYTYLSAACAVQLVRLAATSTSVIWRDPCFWVYVAFFATLGPAIPFLGMLNQLSGADQQLANSLYYIVDVLFMAQFILLGVAGLLLHPSHPFRAPDGV